MSADLMGMKESFTLMVQKVQPWILSHFMIWLDLKVAEYKVLGHMILDQSGLPTLHWLSDNVLSQTNKPPNMPYKENQETLEFHVTDQSQLAPITKQFTISSQAQTYQSQSTSNADSLLSTSVMNSATSGNASGNDFATSSHVMHNNDNRNEEIVTTLMTMDSQEHRNQLVNEIDLQTHNLQTVASRSNYQTVEPMTPSSEFNNTSIDLTDEPEIKIEPPSPDNLVILNDQISMSNNNESFLRVSQDQNGAMTGISHNRLSSSEDIIHLPKGQIATIHMDASDPNDTNSIMLPLQTSHTPTQSEQEINNARNMHLSSTSDMSQEFNDRILVQNVSSFKLPNTSRRKGANSNGNKKWSSNKISNRSLNVSGSKLMCQTCGTFFRCRSSLSRHKWLHGEKRHRCFICEKAFHRKEHLYLHLERHAKCKMCHLKGNSLQAIEEHFKQCHPDAT